jgi:hypothetical protein
MESKLSLKPLENQCLKKDKMDENYFAVCTETNTDDAIAAIPNTDDARYIKTNNIDVFFPNAFEKIE